MQQSSNNSLTFIADNLFCVSVHSDGGSSVGRADWWLDGGEDWQEGQSDVMRAAICLRLHHHHRGAERVDVLRWQNSDRPRQRHHLAGCPGMSFKSRLKASLIFDPASVDVKIRQFDSRRKKSISKKLGC